MFITIREHLAEVLQYIQYKVLRARYSFPLPRVIKFDTEIDNKSKTLLISSTDYPGLYAITPMDNEQEIVNLVNDAIFTYFDVPRYIAKRTENHFCLALPDKYN